MRSDRPLDQYGSLLFSYKGSGQLTLEDGSTFPCEFEAGQMKTSSILLIIILSVDSVVDFADHQLRPIDNAVSFEGITTDGLQKVVTKSAFNRLELSHNMGTEVQYIRILFQLRTLEVTNIESKDSMAKGFKFGITNFRFWGTEKRADNGFVLPLNLSGVKVFIDRLNNYQEIVASLGRLQPVDVTSEIVIDNQADSNSEVIENIIDDLCHILSVARGTKIQWVYRTSVDSDGNDLACQHFSRYTTAYGRNSLIDAQEHMNGELGRFIELTYPVYVAKRDSFKLNTGLISGYLEGKAEGDLLERRAIKLTLTLEMLKAVYLSLPTPPIKEFILDTSVFEGLAKPLGTILRCSLQCAHVDPDSITQIVDKLRELNRTSFKRILEAIFEDLGFQPDRQETRLFISCRDCLVHTGTFFRPSPEDRRFFYYRRPQTDEVQKAGDKFEDFAIPEYFFIKNFVDRVMLKVLGYNGPFNDVRIHSLERNQTGNPGILK